MSHSVVDSKRNSLDSNNSQLLKQTVIKSIFLQVGADATIDESSESESASEKDEKDEEDKEEICNGRPEVMFRLPSQDASDERKNSDAHPKSPSNSPAVSPSPQPSRAPRLTMVWDRLFQESRTPGLLWHRDASIRSLLGYVAPTTIAYENTYRLTPEADHTFRTWTRTIREQLRATLGNHFGWMKNVERRLLQVETKRCADGLLRQLKTLELPRYKYVVTLFVAQDVINPETKGSQAAHSSLSVASRCLWNTNLDDFVSARFQANSISCCATVYALYAD